MHARTYLSEGFWWNFAIRSCASLVASTNCLIG